MKVEPASKMSLVSGKYHEPKELYGVNLASAKAEIRHVFGFNFFLGALPPVIQYSSVGSSRLF